MMHAVKTLPGSDLDMSTDDKLKDFNVRSKHYGEYIKTYSDRKLYKEMFKPLEHLNLKETEVLDLGSGIGLSSIHLKNRVRNIYYLDYSYEMVSEGLKRGLIDANKVIIHDFAKGSLPFDEERFDIVIARYCIHDVKEKTELFAEISRVLRANGLFQMVDMYAIDEISRSFYNKIHGWKTQSGIPVDTFIESLDAYRNLFEESGMIVVSVSFYKSKVHTIEWVLENQITNERRMFIEQMALQEIKSHPSLKIVFGVRMSRGKGLYMEFPVVVMTGRKKLDT